MKNKPLFPNPVSRTIATTVGILVVAVVMTAAIPVYLPINEASAIALPIILFPATWLLLFLWAAFQPSMLKVWGGLGALFTAHLAIILTSLSII